MTLLLESAVLKIGQVTNCSIKCKIIDKEKIINIQRTSKEIGTFDFGVSL